MDQASLSCLSSDLTGRQARKLTGCEHLTVDYSVVQPERQITNAKKKARVSGLREARGKAEEAVEMVGKVGSESVKDDS